MYKQLNYSLNIHILEVIEVLLRCTKHVFADVPETREEAQCRGKRKGYRSGRDDFKRSIFRNWFERRFKELMEEEGW